MIIKDKKGLRYQLLKTELRSTGGFKFTSYTVEFADIYVRYIVKFRDIHAHGGVSAQLYTRNCFTGREFGAEWYSRVPITETAIGCREFTKTAMRKIQAAIKAAGKKVKR